ncbi:MAG: hypothetical protein HQ519_16315 [Planctomycetes bacterium]|nr:hypothetical protein [Planctomycetota bacterium]
MRLLPNKSYFFCLWLLIALLVGTRTSKAQEVFTLGLNGDLWSIDPNSCLGTFIGNTGHHDYFWNGLSQDSNGRIVSAYGNDVVGYSFFELDPTTAAATHLLSTWLYWIEAIAFGPTNELFVVHDPTAGTWGGVYDLYSVDLTTGSIALIGSTGKSGIHALEYFDGTLYGFDTSDGLITLDTTTGFATDLNSNFRGHIGSTSSMCFDQNGVIYYVDQALWMMDRDSGIANPVNLIHPFGYWGEAIFREGQAPHFSLRLDGTAGHYMVAKMAGATPNSQVMLMWAKDRGGPSPIPNGLPCSGTMMNLNSNLGKVAIVDTDANGEAVVGPGPRRVPSAAAGLIWFQAIDLSNCNTSNRIQLRY